ncbi:MAG: hypothetical protein WD649_04085 [Thermoleophilaceae bacterium]
MAAGAPAPGTPGGAGATPAAAGAETAAVAAGPRRAGTLSSTATAPESPERPLPGQPLKATIVPTTASRSSDDAIRTPALPMLAM